MKGITPGAELQTQPKETVTIEQSDIKNAYDNINDEVSDIDLSASAAHIAQLKKSAKSPT